MNQKERKNKTKENFIAPTGAYVGYSVYFVFHFVAFIFAIYLSFKCNGEFKITSFLAAFCCPWIYIIYILATRGNKFCFDYVNGKPL